MLHSFSNFTNTTDNPVVLDEENSEKDEDNTPDDVIAEDSYMQSDEITDVGDLDMSSKGHNEFEKMGDPQNKDFIQSVKEKMSKIIEMKKVAETDLAEALGRFGNM